MPFYLLTAFGKDRAGIVADVTRLLVAYHGNIEDATMTRLGGEFAMMLIVGLRSPPSQKELERDLARLGSRKNLTLQAKPIAASLAQRRSTPSPSGLISVYGVDKPGIVHAITAALARRKISITDLNTQVVRKAKRPLYMMLIEVQVPQKRQVPALRRELQRLGRRLRVTVTWQDIQPVVL